MPTVQLDLSPTFLHQRLAFTRSILLGHAAAAQPGVSVIWINWREQRIWLMPLLMMVSRVTMVVSLIVGVALLGPWLYYSWAPADIVPVQALEAGSALGGAYQAEKVQTSYQPPKNTSLPEGSWLSIPTIGVRSQLRPTEDPEEALRQGIWLAPDHGQPGDTTQPMIVAGHRYGYKVWWQDDYWKYHSFYKLPELKPGDIVEVTHDQRKWLYEIYAGEEGEEITDYNADLILYTCKFLNSPIRHFRYARLIDPTKDTQQAW